jgi:tetratricopeptide (TPR) repeat protein
MTTIIPQDLTCSFCGNSSPQHLLGSTNSFGRPDLDTRPPEMMRSTMHLWVQECPHCGYVAKDISQPAHDSARLYCGESGWRGIPYLAYPELARKFLKLADLQEGVGHMLEAAWSALRAAWACDDAATDHLAISCRQRAIGYFARIPNTVRLFAKDMGAMEALFADLHRRAGDFEGAVHWADIGLDQSPDSAISAILYFQRAKAILQDRSRYTGEDV